jgi:hypothetical protein
MTRDMEIPQYSKVQILVDRFDASDGVTAGTEGYVIEIHKGTDGPAYEVEVMNPDGTTRALIVAKGAELEVVT